MRGFRDLPLEEILREALRVALEREDLPEDPVLSGFLRHLALRLEEAREAVLRLPEKVLLDLFCRLGLPAPDPLPARTVLVFRISEKADSPQVAPRGLTALAGEIPFETEEEGLLLPGGLLRALVSIPSEDFLAEVPEIVEEGAVDLGRLSSSRDFRIEADFSAEILFPGEVFRLRLEGEVRTGDFQVEIEGAKGRRGLTPRPDGSFRVPEDLEPLEEKQGPFFRLILRSPRALTLKDLALLPGPAGVTHVFCGDRPLVPEPLLSWISPVSFIAGQTMTPWRIPPFSFFEGPKRSFRLENPFGKPPLPGLALAVGGFWLLPGTEFTVSTEGDLSLEELSFEYFDGGSWKALLPVDGRVTFPPDARPTRVNQVYARWLRVRYTGAYRPPAPGKSPSDYGLEFRVQPALSEEGLKPRTLRVFNLGEEAQELPPESPHYGLKRQEGALYLRLPGVFHGGPVSFFFSGGPSGEGSFEGLRRLEVSTPAGFVPVALEDHTRGWSTPGFFRFYLPEELGKTRLFGEEGAWLRLVFLKKDLKRLRMQGLFLNAISARQGESLSLRYRASGVPGETLALKPLVGEIQITVEGQPWRAVHDLSLWGPEDPVAELDPQKGRLRFGDGVHGRCLRRGQQVEVRYRSHQGLRGNLPAGSVKDLSEALPFLEGVFQPEPASGGQDPPPPEALLRDLPARIRHRERALTPPDLEDRLREIEGLKAATYRIEEGRLRLFVLPISRDPRPTLSEGLKERIVETLAPGLPLTLRDFEVEAPLFLPVNVEAELLVVPGVSLRRALARARRALENFLHPVEGGPQGQGWPFGRWPLASDFYRLLQDLPEIRAVVSLRASVRREEEDLPYGEGLPPPLPDFALPTPGQISVRGLPYED